MSEQDGFGSQANKNFGSINIEIMDDLGSQQNTVLSGAGAAHFDGFLHGVPPGWRLLYGRKVTLCCGLFYDA